MGALQAAPGPLPWRAFLPVGSGGLSATGVTVLPRPGTEWCVTGVAPLHRGLFPTRGLESLGSGMAED